MNEAAPSYSSVFDQAQNPGVVNYPLRDEGPIIVTAPVHQKSTAILGLFALGIVQISLGALSIVAHSLSFIDYYGWNVIGTGIWCGVMYIVCGVFGVIPDTACRPCRVITYFVMNITIAATFSAVAVIFAVFDIIVASYYASGLAVAMCSIVMIASFAEFVICIVCCGLCGYLVCCAPKVGTFQQTPQFQVMHMMPQSHTNYQMVAVPYNVQGQPTVMAPMSNQTLPAQQMMVLQQQPMMGQQMVGSQQQVGQPMMTQQAGQQMPAAQQQPTNAAAISGLKF